MFSMEEFGGTRELELVITQNTTAPNIVAMEISPTKGNDFLVMGYRLSISAVATARDCVVRLKTPTSTMMNFDIITMDDNEILEGPGTRTTAHDTTGSTASSIGAPFMPYLLSGASVIRFQATSLATAEVITVILLVRSRKSNIGINAIGSSIVIVETANRFI